MKILILGLLKRFPVFYSLGGVQEADYVSFKILRTESNVEGDNGTGFIDYVSIVCRKF